MGTLTKQLYLIILGSHLNDSFLPPSIVEDNVVHEVTWLKKIKINVPDCFVDLKDLISTDFPAVMRETGSHLQCGCVISTSAFHLDLSRIY